MFAINHEPRGKKKPRKGKASKIRWKSAFKALAELKLRRNSLIGEVIINPLKPKPSRKLAKTGDASGRNCTILH